MLLKALILLALLASPVAGFMPYWFSIFFHPSCPKDLPPTCSCSIAEEDARGTRIHCQLNEFTTYERVIDVVEKHGGLIDDLVLNDCPQPLGDLTYFPKLKVYHLALINCGITSVGPRTFSKSAFWIDHLDLSHNEISSTDFGIHQLYHLLRINLSHNRVKKVPTHLFLHNDDVYEVDLSHNEIETFEPDVFSPKTKLAILDLRENNLKHEPVVPTTNLQSLSLCGNNIAALGQFKCPKSLPTPECSCFAQGIKPKGITVNCRTNAKVTPMEIIQILDDQKVLIESLKIVCGEPMHKLEPLPKLKITRLGFTNCSLDDIDAKAFVELAPHLQQLYLRHNGLPALEFSTHQLDHLEKLDLTYNRLKAIPREAFYYNNQLKTLILSHNEIVSVSSYAFHNDTSGLEVLDLSHNALKEIPTLQLPYLQRLNLSSNAIKRVSNNSLAELPLLWSIDLSNNKIAELNEIVFQKCFIHEVMADGNLIPEQSKSFWAGYNEMVHNKLAQKVGTTEFRYEKSEYADVKAGKIMLLSGM